MKNIFRNLLLIILFSSCKKYLDVKPSKDMVIPATIKDATALMDNYFYFNQIFPFLGLIGDDNYYLSDSYFNTLNSTNQGNYIWSKDLYNNNEWLYMYRNILITNIALETLNSITPSVNEQSSWNTAKGTALFHRGHCFFQLAEYYATPYEKNTSTQKPGIPLRLSSDINLPTQRATLEQTWQQILADLKSAATLLPTNVSIVSRPSKQAAFALLARTYLCMNDYVMAGMYADSSLQIQNELLNYNSLAATSNTPFPQFNKEVIFSNTAIGSSMLKNTNWKCDSILYSSYNINDLRRVCFFLPNGTSTWGFKGNYDGSTSISYFIGPAVDEMYLIKAESLARTGNFQSAMNTLNSLLVTRWKTGKFVPFLATTQQQALDIILSERRKELVMRGTRWFDLRRLNLDPQYAKTLIRKVNGETYTLSPNDPRYTHYIPENVIAMSGIEQNFR